MSIELPVTTKHHRDMTDNVESDVKPEQTNKQTFFLSYLGPHDDARMNLSMTISAVRHGGSLVNYTEQ